jgi:DNA polymerase III epsilon subunit family exonuclease
MRWQKTDDDYLQTKEFVAFDTETTGIWAPANRIVEIGAVKFRLGQEKTDRFQELINPERDIPAEVVDIHGITNSMVQSCRTVEPVLQSFFDFCGPDSILIAHNAQFDISFVGCEADRVGLPLPENPVIDTVDIFRRRKPGLDSYSLISLAREFKMASDQNHRAADDAALVWRLFSMVSEDFPHFQAEGEFKREFNFYRMADWEGERRELPEQYADITRAIEEDRALEIVYSSNGRPPEKRIIRPRRVHFLRSSYYIAAYCERARMELTFRLDRIRGFRLV